MNHDFPDRLYGLSKTVRKFRARKRQLTENCTIYLTIVSLLKIFMCFTFRLLTSCSKSSLQPKGFVEEISDT